MKTITHLIDDAAVGGVNRMLCDQTRALGSRFLIERQAVTPRRPLPPRVSADVTIVHFTSSWSKLPFLTLLRAQRGDDPVVIVEHTFTRSFETQCVPSNGRFRRMLRLSYRLADVVVAVSHGQARWMMEAELLPPEKLVVIQPSVDVTNLLKLRPRHSRPSAPIRLAAYGRFCRQKGFDVLLEAMRQLSPNVATLTIAGYGPDAEMLRQAAIGLPHVKIDGPISDLSAFLADHDAVVVPSRWEAFGLVALEARAAALPIVVCDTDGLNEQVGPHYGVTVAGQDPSSLADAIQSLRARDLGQMGIDAQTSVGRHFDQHVEQWANLLDRSVLNAVPALVAA